MQDLQNQNRRTWISTVTAGIAGTVAVGLCTSPDAFARALSLQAQQADETQMQITADMVKSAAWIADLPLTAEHCEEIAKTLSEQLKTRKELRAFNIDDDTPTATAFVPHFFVAEPPRENSSQPSSAAPNVTSAVQVRCQWRSPIGELPKTESVHDAAFWTIQQLGEGLRQKRFTSVELTQMYLDRLAKYDPQLHCVVTINPKAIDEAKQADQRFSANAPLGPLDGIPWGAKDIISVPGMPTTWGAVAYRDRVRNTLATSAKRMQDSGAVLLGKLTVGTLAWGDEWFGGMTRNPWNPERGSSGSSAGSSCAVAAGLCGFALGSETLGSIVSPTRTCLTNGLRPTFGRVSRAGCMTLAWTMDKIGPIARNIEDCAVVFSKLVGSDGLDPTVVERDFHWPPEQWAPAKLKIGVLGRLRTSEQLVVDKLKEQGAEIVPLEFTTKHPIGAMVAALGVEAASMHDSLFRSAANDEELGKWGPTFREAQFTTGVDYVRGLRARVSMIQETERELAKVDFLVGDGDLARMNLTGHPSLVVAMGTNPERKTPYTVVLTGKLFSESVLLRAGTWIQELLPPTPRDPVLTEPAA